MSIRSNSDKNFIAYSISDVIPAIYLKKFSKSEYYWSAPLHLPHSTLCHQMQLSFSFTSTHYIDILDVCNFYNSLPFHCFNILLVYFFHIFLFSLPKEINSRLSNVKSKHEDVSHTWCYGFTDVISNLLMLSQIHWCYL